MGVPGSDTEPCEDRDRDQQGREPVCDRLRARYRGALASQVRVDPRDPEAAERGRREERRHGQPAAGPGEAAVQSPGGPQDQGANQRCLHCQCDEKTRHRRLQSGDRTEGHEALAVDQIELLGHFVAPASLISIRSVSRPDVPEDPGVDVTAKRLRRRRREGSIRRPGHRRRRPDRAAGRAARALALQVTRAARALTAEPTLGPCRSSRQAR